MSSNETSNTSSGTDQTRQLQDAVQQAYANGTPLCITGGGSKAFYGRPAAGDVLDVTGHAGIIDYKPAELVLTARAGTPLSHIEAVLKEQGQMLAFEPPHFGENATLGGAIACGLSGPRRPYAGAARDFVLGATLINGKGEVLRFGGQVMKNVAGYDTSRLMVGAMGTLGVLLELSIKVLPLPERETTRVLKMSATEAIARMNSLAATSTPLSAASHADGLLYLRLSGTEAGVRAAVPAIGGDPLEQDVPFWNGLRECALPFFHKAQALWRLSLAPATAPLDIPGDTLLDWGGAQRWLKSAVPAATIRAAVQQHGGHATLFHAPDQRGDIFQPLPAPLAALHLRLKDAFDPKRILNRGRMYEDL